MTGDLRRGSRSDDVSAWHIWQRNRKRRAGGAQFLNAALFDGSTNYYTRASPWDGAVNGTTGIFFSWFRLDGGNGSLMSLMEDNNGTLYMNRLASNQIEVHMQNASATTTMDLTSSTTFTASTTWRPMLATWNVTSGDGSLYIDDVLEATATIVGSSAIVYNRPSWGWASRSGGANFFNGALSETYFNTVTDIGGNTISVEDRAKFYNANLTALPNLGSDGSTPTGAQPAVYLSANGLNRGSGGDMVAVNSPGIIEGPPLS